MAVFTGNGSSASPSFTFSSATTTGIFRRGNGAIGLSIGNSDNHQFNANGTSFFNQTTFEVSQTGVINHGTRFSTLVVYGEQPTTGKVVYLDSGTAFQNLLMYGDNPGTASGAWVVESASIPGSGSSSQAMWLKTAGGGGAGTTRHDLWVDGEVRIGGTLPSAPLAQITTAGRGYFKDRVTTGAGNAVFAGTATNRYEEIPASTAKTFTITNPCVLGGVLRFNGGFYVNASNGYGIISLVVYGDSTSTGNYTIVEEYNAVSGSVGAITVTKSAGSLSFNVTNNNATQAMFFNWSALYSGDTATAKQISFAIA